MIVAQCSSPRRTCVCVYGTRAGIYNIRYIRWMEIGPIDRCSVVADGFADWTGWDDDYGGGGDDDSARLVSVCASAIRACVRVRARVCARRLQRRLRLNDATAAGTRGWSGGGGGGSRAFSTRKRFRQICLEMRLYDARLSRRESNGNRRRPRIERSDKRRDSSSKRVYGGSCCIDIVVKYIISSDNCPIMASGEGRVETVSARALRGDGGVHRHDVGDTMPVPASDAHAHQTVAGLDVADGRRTIAPPRFPFLPTRTCACSPYFDDPWRPAAAVDGTECKIEDARFKHYRCYDYSTAALSFTVSGLSFSNIIYYMHCYYLYYR